MGGGLLVAWFPISDTNSRTYYSGTLLKVGFVCGLAWLAAPQLERLGWHRLRGTLLVAIFVVLVLWAIRPKIGALAGILLVGGSLLFMLIGWLRTVVKQK